MAAIIVTLKRAIRFAALSLIRLYRYFLSPFFGNACRFYPSCSIYAGEAINTHGFCKGTYLSLRRVLRCHPWHPGGMDLVPLKKK